jgi:hypothetical protein
MAKYGMSMCVLGMAEELRDRGVAVNALWPRTVIATAALNLLGGDETARHGRTPEVVADAALAILRRDARVADAFAALHADCVAAMDRQLAATLRPAGAAAPYTLALSRSIWILVTGWVTYLYMQRETVTPEAVAGVAPLIAGLLAPYVPA